jgi:hypothetical protein
MKWFRGYMMSTFGPRPLQVGIVIASFKENCTNVYARFTVPFLDIIWILSG